MFNYNSIITSSRLRPSSIQRSFLPDESDRARLLFSSPFRRLQQKAQVFSLEHNSAVRSRLTHSLEVAHLGRSIAKNILHSLKGNSQTYGLNNLDIQQSFIDVVESACLLHDIGNPPFGHFGEIAIRDWFTQHGKELFSKSIDNQLTGTDNERKTEFKNDFDSLFFPDFKEFDGNAQGFRIITRLQWNRDSCGLNLTCSLLAAFIKYLRCPADIKGVDKAKHIYKKPGFFYSEKALFENVWKILGLRIDSRHPLNYIMEASDDIAYCLSDIEDGIEKKLISEDFFKSEIKREYEKIIDGKTQIDILNKCISDAELLANKIQNSFYFNFKIDLTRKLVIVAANEYIKTHKEILEGRRSCGLFDGTDHASLILKALKEFARKNLYTKSDAENIELAGYSIISGLLTKFAPILCLCFDDFTTVQNGGFRLRNGLPTDIERRLFHRLPPKYVKVYKDKIQELADESNIDIYLEEWYYRAHLIVDYISGMTDYHALETFQLLSGIKVDA